MADDIIIDKRFASLLPPLTTEQFDTLKANIKRDGKILKPIVVWKQTGKLLDGHHRKKIAESIGCGFRVERIDLADDMEAMRWIHDHQDGSRQLNEIQRVAGVKKLAEAIADLAKDRQIAGGKFKQELPANLPKAIDTRTEAAKLAGVSERQFDKIESLIESATDPLMALASAKAVSVDAAALVATLPPKQQEKIAAEGPGAVKEKASEIRARKSKARKAKASDPGPNDEVGVPIPDRKIVVEAFASRADFSAALNLLVQIRTHVNRLIGDQSKDGPAHPGGVLLRPQKIIIALEDVRAQLTLNQPYAVCPYCKGKGCKGDGCRGAGWLTEGQYERVPKDERMEAA